MKQTAVEFLEDAIFADSKHISIDLFNSIKEAKEMEKQQIINAYKKGFLDCDDIGIMSYDEYYTETFKK